MRYTNLRLLTYLLTSTFKRRLKAELFSGTYDVSLDISDD